jgi:hypothetical protein
MPRKNPGHLKVVKKTGSALLEDIEHPVLNRKRVTVKGMVKYKAALLAALAPHLLPETLLSLRKQVADGDTKAADTILKAFDVLRSPGINVSQTNTNMAATEVVGGHRTYDAYMRDRAVEKRMVLDIEPAVEEATAALAGAPPSTEPEEAGE